jgi:SAM-dependent methyltransferase
MGELLNLRVRPAQPCEIDFAWYQDIRAGLLQRTVGQADRVLDVGCGRGNVLLMLSKQIGEGVGIDISKDDVTCAERTRKTRNITHVTFRRADATALPFPAGSFDVVLFLGDVLTYPNLYGKHKVVIAELRRALKKGGIAVHESMNWAWEYRSYPSPGVSFTRSDTDGFIFHRTRRTASGSETTRDYEVRPGTPLYRWLLEQKWPMSSQGWNTSLDVEEETPIPKEWLKFRGVGRYKHYRSEDLKRLYRTAGFRHPNVFAYGQTYDIAAKAGLLQHIGPFQSELAAAEAELAFTLRLGSGPWLFLVAEK